MKKDTRESLLVGFYYYLAAQAAESTKAMISDGYQALDNFFSALLIELRNINPPKNHKVKLNIVLNEFGDLFKNKSIEEDTLKQFYYSWLNVRYTSKIPTTKEAINFLRVMHKVFDTILEEISKHNGMKKDELENLLYEEQLSGRWTAIDEEIAMIHEAWQSELERLGEMGVGSKLGNKLINPSNFCNILASSDDSLTREIIAKDKKVAEIIGEIYQKFLDIVEHIRYLRFQRGIPFDEAPNFVFGLRINYHGQNVKDFIKDFAQLLKEALSKIKNDKAKKAERKNS
ncbi:MAG: hypothetical protein ACP6IS_11650 [Candidatus Asgardarchaeia archaeon]